MIAAHGMLDVDLIALPGGVFSMGSSLHEIEEATKLWAPRLLDSSFTEVDLQAWLMKEYPKHRVPVRPFIMSRFPITNGQFRAFTAATEKEPPESVLMGEPDDHPVWGVTYEDACQFCAWLTAPGTTVFRLPTEAEWEYAARGPMGREFPFGNRFDPTLCNTAEAGIGHTTPVDRYLNGASGWGVVDLAGNVEEWTSDVYKPYPGGRFADDHLSAANRGSYRVLRGGSFARGGDLARCARRHGPHPAPEYRYRGFRVVAGGRG
jgi:formylglycine-generating enzyme required for sulfatase activity